HTDCLIQIVKERRSFWLLREWHSTQPPSRVKPYFQRLFEATDSGFALPLAVSMEAHYREPRRDDKGNFAKNWHFSCFGRSSVYLSNKKALHPQGSSRFHTAMAIFLTRNRGQNCALCPSR
ncbi:hypothetical protein ACET6Q_21220, partial [Aeromonas dhakensis]|uniref:hypothetical protein n=1 Tax=Aeromonas dhakensis TaxID=196024 RepID=UPI0038CFDAEE